ncbi:MAG: hypothetical protein PVI99_05390 [Anaerolineales bacterium]
MSENQVFLACYNGGISRAEKNQASTWIIDHALNNLRVTCLTKDPLNSDVVYAGTRGNGIWRSEDKGKTWGHRGLDDQIIMSVAVSPHSSQNNSVGKAKVFAGTKSALMFCSSDSGSEWEELEGFRRIPNRWWWFSPADPPGKEPYVISIAPSPVDPDVILAGVELGGVFRSGDGGQTWSRHLKNTLRDCHSLKFHHSNGNWVYEAGGTGGGAAFSNDGGRTWQKAKKGLAKNYGIVCAADPEKPEIWYVCVAPGPNKAHGTDPEIYLYRSTAGIGWQPIGWEDHPINITPNALVTLPGLPGRLYAGLRNGDVWQTNDYGDSWEKLSFNLGGITSSMLVWDEGWQRLAFVDRIVG